MRSTSDTAAMSTVSAVRVRPKITSSRRSTNAPRPALSCGYVRSRSAAIVTISSCADETVAPLASRPTMMNEWFDPRAESAGSA
jgi:hypothetical protein